MRTNPDELEFIEFLRNLGDGSVEHEVGLYYSDMIKLPRECIIRGKNDESVGTIGDLITHTFGEYIDPNNTLNRAILTPLNQDSLKLNEEILDRLIGKLWYFISLYISYLKPRIFKV